MSINERILSFLTMNSLKQIDLADYIGVSTSTLNNWLKLGRDIPAKFIIPICEFFQVSVYLLLTGKDGEGGLKLTKSETDLLQKFRSLPESYQGRLLGRAEVYIEEYNITIFDPLFLKEESHEYNVFRVELWGDISAGGGIDAIANREVINAPVKCDFALRVKGDSMEPTFKNNSVIFLIQDCELKYNGEIAAVQVDDFTSIGFLKKVYKKEETVYLVSINPTYGDIVLPAEKVTILGKVVYPQV